LLKVIESIHATAVFWYGKGFLLKGASGAGKSDTALRLISKGALLIADDQVILSKESGHIYASPPQLLQGVLEIRGLGLYSVPFLEKARLHFIIDCVSNPPRFPEPLRETVLGVDISVFLINPFEVSFIDKILCLLEQIGQAIPPAFLEDTKQWQKRPCLPVQISSLSSDFQVQAKPKPLKSLET
jgi:hypothetical protein